MVETATVGGAAMGSGRGETNVGGGSGAAAARVTGVAGLGGG